MIQTLQRLVREVAVVDKWQGEPVWGTKSPLSPFIVQVTRRGLVKTL